MIIEKVDFPKLLENIPKGAWVAISQDHSKVVAYSAQLSEAIALAHEAGESDPIVMRVPEASGAWLL